MAKTTIKQLADGFYTALPSYRKIIRLNEKLFSRQEITEAERVDYYIARRMVYEITKHQILEAERLRMMKKLFLTPTGSDYSRRIEERRLAKIRPLIRDAISALGRMGDSVEVRCNSIAIGLGMN